MASGFQFFTSLRYDPALLEIPASGLQSAGWNYDNKSPLYMLDLHRDRMLRAAVHWKWNKAVEVLAGDEGLKRFESYILGAVGEQDKPQRVKITVSEEGVFGNEISPVPPVPTQYLFPPSLILPQRDGDQEPDGQQEWEVVVDEDPSPASEFTHFKTTRRQVYDSARRRAGIKLGDNKEVLLVNRENGQIMEGSMTTPYFLAENGWYTPPVSSTYDPQDGSGGNDGTTRRWALGLLPDVEEQAIVTAFLKHGEKCWLSNGVKGFIPGRISLI